MSTWYTKKKPGVNNVQFATYLHNFICGKKFLTLLCELYSKKVKNYIRRLFLLNIFSLYSMNFCSYITKVFSVINFFTFYLRLACVNEFYLRCSFFQSREGELRRQNMNEVEYLSIWTNSIENRVPAICIPHDKRVFIFFSCTKSMKGHF